MNLISGNTIAASQRDILGLPVCDLGWADAFAFAEQVASMPFGQTVIAFLGADNANLMATDPDYRSVLERQVVLPGGHGIDIASRMLHGTRFPAKLTGTAFVPALLTYIEKPMRVAMIGSRRSTLIEAASVFRNHAPWHEFIPISDSFFNRDDCDAVLTKVRDAAPDILLVSMSRPMQEKWIDRHVGPGHARLVVSVADLFDTVAGGATKPGRPFPGHRLGGLFRLASEPRRLWRRHITDNLAFLYHVARYRLSGIAMREKRPEAGLPSR